MCFLDNCCFCISSRTGMLTYIYLKTILHFLAVAFLMAGYLLMTREEIFLYPFFYLGFYILLYYFLIELPFNICGLVGAHKEHLTLVKIYFCYLIFSTLVFIAGEMWLLSRTLSLIYEFDPPMYTFDLADVIDLTPLLVLIVIQTYMLLVVRGEVARIERKNIPEKEMLVCKEKPIIYVHV